MNFLHFLLLFNVTRFTVADEHDHLYNDGDQIVVWYNTIGPRNNKQETYNYFSLPLCKGPVKDIGHYHETLGEALLGVELENSGIDIKYNKNVPTTVYCSIKLDESTLRSLEYAIRNEYWYQMYIDDLLIWSELGIVDDNGNSYIWTHKKLNIGYNDKQIVDITADNMAKLPLTFGNSLNFSYDVTFHESNIEFDKRDLSYLEVNFFQHRIHWFSIFNSFMMVIFLAGLVIMILMRTLRKDYMRYSNEDDMDELEKDLGDEYGWKQAHGDVFRPATYPVIFSSLIATGIQIFVVSFIMVFLAFMKNISSERGWFLSTSIFIFSLCSIINGFVGGALYSRMGGKKWIRQMMFGTFLLPTLISGTAFSINFFAILYHATIAIPFTTMLTIVCICLFVIFPLNLVGTVVGRNIAGRPNVPCRVSAVPRPIPQKKWFMEPWAVALFGGILPFGSIFIEMYFIFTSFWAYKIYYVYGFTFLVMIIVSLVTSCASVVGTYFLLNSEDYRWQWTSFSCGASIALYVYLYSAYYFYFKTKMYGLFQTIFYFGYMALFSTCLGLMCGAVSFLSTSYFVKKIYSTIKIE